MCVCEDCCASCVFVCECDSVFVCKCDSVCDSVWYLALISFPIPCYRLINMRERQHQAIGHTSMELF